MDFVSDILCDFRKIRMSFLVTDGNQDCMKRGSCLVHSKYAPWKYCGDEGYLVFHRRNPEKRICSKKKPQVLSTLGVKHEM